MHHGAKWRCVQVVSVLLLVCGGRAFASDADVEQSLLQLYQHSFPGAVDFAAKIEYPKTAAYKRAWLSLGISVGKDIAITIGMVNGATEVSAVISAADVVLSTAVALAEPDSDPDEEARLLSHPLAKEGTKEVVRKIAKEASLQSVQVGLQVGKKVTQLPGIATAFSVVGVYNAVNNEESRVGEAIYKQKEIQKFATEIVPEIAAVYEKISKMQSPQKALEYEQVLAAILQKRAELAVYREMSLLDANARDLCDQLPQAIARATGREYGGSVGAVATVPSEPTEIVGIATGNGYQPPMPMRLADIAFAYVRGEMGDDAFESAVRDAVRSGIMWPNGPAPDSEVEKSMEGLKDTLQRIRDAHDKVNTYGGDSASTTAQPGEYAGVIAKIPENYRFSALITSKVEDMIKQNNIQPPPDLKLSPPPETTALREQLAPLADTSGLAEETEEHMRARLLEELRYSAEDTGALTQKDKNLLAMSAPYRPGGRVSAVHSPTIGAKALDKQREARLNQRMQTERIKQQTAKESKNRALLIAKGILKEAQEKFAAQANEKGKQRQANSSQTGSQPTGAKAEKPQAVGTKTGAQQLPTDTKTGTSQTAGTTAGNQLHAPPSLAEVIASIYTLNYIPNLQERNSAVATLRQFNNDYERIVKSISDTDTAAVYKDAYNGSRLMLAAVEKWHYNGEDDIHDGTDTRADNIKARSE